MNVPLFIALMAVLTLMSAFFSLSDAAFSSVSKAKLKQLAEANKKAALALGLSEKSDKLMSTLLICNICTNIAITAIGALLFFEDHGLIASVITTVIVALILLVFGEMIPRAIAGEKAEACAILTAPLARVFMFILTPFSFLLSLINKGIAKMFKSKEKEATSQEELLMIVEEAEQEGELDKEESQLLYNAIEFSELKAEDILTHRVDLEAVSVDADKKDIAHVFSETKFSRLLVYEDSIDNIIGVIHQKDFYHETTITRRAIRDIMTPPIFTLKNESIDDLLKLLQKNKSHVAVIVDEYGGTYGIVTMEDILEELVGEIWDEHDEVTEELTEISENIFHVDGLMNFEDFCEQFGLGEVESQSVSVGGWVAERLEKIPEVEDSFIFESLTVTVSEVDGPRAATLEIEVHEASESEGDDTEKSE